MTSIWLLTWPYADVPGRVDTRLAALPAVCDVQAIRMTIDTYPAVCKDRPRSSTGDVLTQKTVTTDFCLLSGTVTHGDERTDQATHHHRVVYCMSDCSGQRKHGDPVILSSNGRLHSWLNERMLVTLDTRPPVGA